MRIGCGLGPVLLHPVRIETALRILLGTQIRGDDLMIDDIDDLAVEFVPTLP